MLAGLVVLGLTRIDLHQVGHALGAVKAQWVALSWVLMVGAFLARGESWYCTIRSALPDQALGRMAVTRVLLIGMAGSTVAPGRAGEAARAWLIARRAGGVRNSLAMVIGTLVSQSLLNALALLILAVIAIVGGAVPGARGVALAVVVALPTLVIGVLLGGPRLASLPFTERWPRLRRYTRWISRQLKFVQHGLGVYRRPSAAVHSIGFQLGAWAMQWGTCYFMLVAFGLQHQAGVAAAAGVLVAVNITALLPVTPSNVGVFQAACIAVLAPFGVSASHGLAYGLVLQAVEIFSALALGLPSLLGEGISFSELRRRPQPAGGAGE